MLRIAAQRVVQGVIVLVLVSAITFLLVNLAPGGPASLMRMDATPEQRDALTRRFGLDQPVPVRYLQWLSGALRCSPRPSWGCLWAPPPGSTADGSTRS